MDIDGVDTDDGTVARGGWQATPSPAMMVMHDIVTFAGFVNSSSAMPKAARPLEAMALPTFPTSLPIPTQQSLLSRPAEIQPPQPTPPMPFFSPTNWTPEAFQATQSQTISTKKPTTPRQPPPISSNVEAESLAEPVVAQVVPPAMTPVASPAMAPTTTASEDEPMPLVNEVEQPSVAEPAKPSPPKGPKKRASHTPTNVHEIIVLAKEMRLKTAKQPARKLTESRMTGMRPLDVALAEARIISENVYVQRKQRKWEEDEVPICTCKPPPTESDQKGCQEDCVNRAALIECLAEFCPCGDRCDNQRIQRGTMPEAEVIDAGKKGLGIMTRQFIKQGDFVAEYMGEIVTEQEYHLRRLRYHNEKHRYMMVLSGGEVIDATRMGGLARFINHSCDPNCGVEKWEVNGEERCAIFALRDINPGEELSFDYKFQSFSALENTTCLCGSAKCRGYIGANNRVTKQPQKSCASHTAPPGDRNKPRDPITKRARSSRKTLELALERMYRALAGHRMLTRREIAMVLDSRLLLKRNLARNLDDNFSFLCLEPYFVSDDNREFTDMEPVFNVRNLPEFPPRPEVIPKAIRQERLEVVLERLRTRLQ